MPQILQIAVIGLATLGGSAATMTVMKPDIPDFSVPAGDWSAGGLLDGTSFYIVGTDLDSGHEMTDTLVFRDGTFQSVNCQIYCDFGFSRYETKVVDDVVHFTATTHCPDAPHTIVWYGSVTDDGIEVSGTWTTRRWYWSHQIRFSAEESLVPPVGDAVSG